MAIDATAPAAQSLAGLRTSVRPDALAAFRNRLAKTFRHWSRWAARRGYGVYRCYDRDVPEFPLVIDVYVPDSSPAAARLHLQEQETGWRATAAEHAAWVAAVHDVTAQACGVVPGDIVFKARPRRRRGAQHEPTGKRGRDFMVVESGLRFWVNLEAYLDTGLFADHRAMRAMVRAGAAGKRVLNLFSYTGSFTVYAAAGGAVRSTSVDLSSTYQRWAARNFAANGIDERAHELVRANVLDWLDEALRHGERFDLVVLDPPAFSNSKAMAGALDIQRDHAHLVTTCRHLLAPGGELLFSTNLRSFTLDPRLARDPACVDITRETAAPDYRDARVHRAYRIRAAESVRP